MTKMIQRWALLAAVLFGSAGCGLSIEDSVPLAFVAPLEGTWVLQSDSSVELRITVPGGQDPYATDFQFSAEIVDSGQETIVQYAGTASGQDFELRDPGNSALIRTGSVVLDSTSQLMLSDGSMFGKPFVPDFTTGTWQDVNKPTRFYKFEVQNANAGTAAGCAADTAPSDDAVEGLLTVVYNGESIPLFRVDSTGGLAVRSPAKFFGASAIRVVRVSGFLHLQRVDRNDSCP